MEKCLKNLKLNTRLNAKRDKLSETYYLLPHKTFEHFHTLYCLNFARNQLLATFIVHTVGVESFLYMSCVLAKYHRVVLHLNSVTRWLESVK